MAILFPYKPSLNTQAVQLTSKGLSKGLHIQDLNCSVLCLSYLVTFICCEINLALTLCKRSIDGFNLILLIILCCGILAISCFYQFGGIVTNSLSSAQSSVCCC